MRIGEHQCDAWYYSSYPPTYHNIDTLYLCEFCLSFYAVKTELLRHSLRCPLWHPPGDEVYRDADSQISVFEVDGLKNPVYCENLSFLSKLFLDHKNIEYDTTVFLYYVLTEIRGREYHLAGYFSKVSARPLSPKTPPLTSPASSSCPTTSEKATASSSSRSAMSSASSRARQALPKNRFRIWARKPIWRGGRSDWWTTCDCAADSPSPSRT